MFSASIAGLPDISPSYGPLNDASKRILLNNLPKLLAGYGKSWYEGYPAVVFVVCDLDDKCLKSFKQELMTVLNSCESRPETRFCFAIEEGEGWLLGDIPAIKKAYPKAKNSVLNNYINDEICGSWEWLADAVFKDGLQALSKLGWQRIGTEKSAWAYNIAPHMTPNDNKSPSFNYFLGKLQELSN